MGQKFYEWVRKWKIGPGMNDDAHSKSFLKDLAAAEDGSFLARYRDSSKEGLKLMEEGLYSGFDGAVGDGWIPILDRLAEDLIRMGWDRDLRQVKEKFGTLRFYVGDHTEEMSHRIFQAEEESGVTCEECGKPGEVDGPGWLKCLCAECRTQRYNTNR